MLSNMIHLVVDDIFPAIEVDTDVELPPCWGGLCGQRHSIVDC
jgi:hypothetical protein